MKDAQLYNEGMSALKTVHRALKDKSISFDTFIEFLKWNSFGDEKIPQEDFDEFVETIGFNSKAISKISWFSTSDFDDLMISIAQKTPVGKLPDRKMIISAFLNPETFSASFLDIASMTAIETAKGVRAVADTAVDVGSWIVNWKTPIFLVGAGFLVYKLLGQSDKIKAGYNTVKKDLGGFIEKERTRYEKNKRGSHE